MKDLRNYTTSDLMFDLLIYERASYLTVPQREKLGLLIEDILNGLKKYDPSALFQELFQSIYNGGLNPLKEMEDDSVLLRNLCELMLSDSVHDIGILSKFAKQFGMTKTLANSEEGESQLK
jgi:hypothetical protein